MKIKSSKGNGKISRTVKLQMAETAIQAIIAGQAALGEVWDPALTGALMVGVRAIGAMLGVYIRSQTTGPLE